MIFSRADITRESLQRERANISRILDIQRVEDALYFPRYVQIETVRECNARCPFCAYETWDKSLPFMDDALYERLVGQLRPFVSWVRWVNLQKVGEALLDDKIAPRVRMMKEIGIKHVILASNGALLTEDKACELFAAGLDEMMISIDTVDPTKYPQMRVGLDYDTVIANAKAFFRIRDHVRPQAAIRIRGVFMGKLDSPEGRAEALAYEDFWAPYRRGQDRVHFQRPYDWGGRHTWRGRLKPFGDLFHPCIIPWSTLSVSASGKIALCPIDFDASLGLGDANHESLVEVWRGAALEKIRSLHSSGERNVNTVCRGCVLYDRETAYEEARKED